MVCTARDGCTSDTGMYSSADGCIYRLCWPENSEKSALPRCPVLIFLGFRVCHKGTHYPGKFKKRSHPCKEIDTFKFET